MTRRELLKWGSAAGLAGLGTAITPPRTRVLRVAHLTDIHVYGERRAAQGMEACLDHVQAQKPNLILNGGDSIMDALNADEGKVREQWRLFQSVLKANIATPIAHAIGNHDIWGWEDPKADKAKPLYGKRWAMDELSLERSYYSFDRAGWHFVVLDSMSPRRGLGYVAFLGDKQLEWLKADLAKVRRTTPILILSHIPILTVCPLFDPANDKLGYWRVPSSMMHVDNLKLKNLFKNTPNVNLCISGHCHMKDEVTYCGTSYACNGAVSGGWWKGAHRECDPGYAIIDLYSDGSFDREYIEFGWKTVS